jgi:hypothetical protein
MRFIPTTAHGLAGYVVGLIVVGLPFHFAWTGPSRVTFVTLGLLVICYSLLTDYELCLVRILRIHSPVAGRSVRPRHARGPDVAPPSDDSRIPVYAIGALSLLLSLTTKIRAQNDLGENS